MCAPLQPETSRNFTKKYGCSVTMLMYIKEVVVLLPQKLSEGLLGFKRISEHTTIVGLVGIAGDYLPFELTTALFSRRR